MKEQYIRKISHELMVSHKVKKEILRDLEEAFASAKEHGETEEQVIERLGEPKEYAKNMNEQFSMFKRLSKKQIVAIACSFVIVVIFGILSAVFIPAIIQRGNPIPYLKAISQLDDTNPVVIVEDNNADGIVLIAADGNIVDVFGYIYEKTGLPHGLGNAVYTVAGLPYDDEYDYEHKIVTLTHGKEDFTLELQPYLNKYQICDIPKEMFELPQNHEMLDESLFAGRGGELKNVKTKEQVHELFGEPDAVDSNIVDGNIEVYHDCFGRAVTFTYDEDNKVMGISKSGM